MTSLPDHSADTAASGALAWNHRFASLGSDFYTTLQPTPLREPYWVSRNAALARELGLAEEWLGSEQALQAFAGNEALPGGHTLASVYSGHQFGQWAGQLGDGRAMLLGELQTPQGGRELQLKGAGRTPYSRMGDGRAVLRSSVREYLCSEAMHGLGIPTTRALCITGSDDRVLREEIETASVVTRVAPSFIRFGHFEHFSYSDQTEQLKRLADYVIRHFYPDCQAQHDQAQPYVALLQAVSERTAALLASWQAVGFCHGVMNTDNMSILGLTVDYGPFQFLDGFNPGHICNHSDNQGRYAFNKQPNVAYWNLFCLGQALLPLMDSQEQALGALESYKTVFPDALQARMRAKLGLTDAAQPEDKALIEDIYTLLAAEQVDYTIFWRRLCEFHSASQNSSGRQAVRDLFVDRPGFDAWAQRYAQRCADLDSTASRALMRRSNPAYVLRNHLGEQAIRAAKLHDFSEADRLLTVLQTPFDDHPGCAAYADFPPDWAAGIDISCSS